MTRQTASHTMFRELSDDDSIATDSTAPSEPRDDYPVEKILCEHWDPEDQCTEYLVKWEGYPLDRANYEPAVNFVGDAILPEWEARKARIEQGLEQPFNEDDWYKAVQVAEVEKEIRNDRRKAKRRKRGKPVSPDETDNNDGGEDESSEEDVPLANNRARNGAAKTSPAKNRVKQPEVQRKGLAKKITTKRRAPSASSSSQSDSASEDSRDSLLAEVRGSASRRKSAVIPAPPARSNTNNAVVKKPSVNKRISTVDRSPEDLQDRRPAHNTQPAVKQPVEQRKFGLPSKALVSSAARKSAPSTGATTVFTKSASAPTKDIFANWTAPKAPRERPRVSGETPKDSDGNKFTKLSEQNRFQKYSRNEKAPDVHALTMLDPKTGKLIAPSLDITTTGSPLQASAPPMPARPAASDLGRDNSPNIVPIRQNSGIVSRTSTNETTCTFWLRGGCRFTAAECKFAHYDTGVHSGVPGTYGKGSATYAPPAESILPKTCWWWRQPQGCSKSDEECQFAHHDYAPRPPGTFKEGATASAQHSASPVSADIPPPPPPELPTRSVCPSETTCYWWLQPNGCNKPDHLCEFAHRDTGIHAGRPGSYRKAFGEARDRQPNPNLFQPPPPPPPVTESSVLQSARTPSLANATANVTLLLCLSGAEEPLRLTAQLEVQDLAEIERLLGTDAILKATRVVTVDDFKNIISTELGGSRTSFGGIHIKKTQRSEAEAVTEMLNRHGSALVASVPARDVHAIIWPARAERWKYLDDISSTLSNESVLHFRMFPNLPGFEGAQNSEASADKPIEQQHHAVNVGEVLAGLDAEKLLPKRDGNKPSDRAVFLMFPQTHTVEIQVCAEYFQAAGLKVYHSEILGAWDHFRRTHTNACSIVLHPDVPMWEIPGLHHILSMTAAKFFTLGTNGIVAEVEDREPAYCCDRIFPHGNVAFITDELFVYHPEKATEVIKAFLEANRYKPEGGENNRIATRPGIKGWLLKLAMEQTAEHGRQDERWMQLYDAICRLCPPDDEDPFDPGGIPSPTSNLVSVPPEHLPSFDGIWEKDETTATDYMVNWFAGWAVLNASKYRRLVVCNEPRESRTVTTKDKNGKMVSQVDADPRSWAKKYQHIGVALPSKVAGMLNAKWKK
ncbi:hypothetical protein CLAFUW4_03364 [Fulvia fulva]|uniref:Chromo domain-containing protein n=1 Tax=Passalora fulva TaxID=5499 RepID=A0A9Q8LAI8_PASFU|nr:uncharacterized protein CLAFUR5_03344 [Fulvia fulva]KAK4631977.1 hypothetical protein CLAFUR4_03353 [Fulvia fulva]KAK4633088.1 hypothetical protein CLAFUR0_03358 [Fulvia fulva]UJO13878.1 hypothetical protein CLAFUR5_03344 [Fulvia fulva]WPV11365.1 hypothetical protein CLAFUW4_03364 [Fulvia fulva]WPV25999.1 hypothetical protein CLAFUW7_03356 [Fulvia fulva]